MAKPSVITELCISSSASSGRACVKGRKTLYLNYNGERARIDDSHGRVVKVLCGTEQEIVAKLASHKIRWQ